MGKNDCYYRLSWVSCDGAGSNDEKIVDQQIAIEQADTAQAGADLNGNAWGYSYKVRREYENSSRMDTIYNARTSERYP